MSKNRGSKNSKIVPLFITFAILFVVVFALGVIIGKGLGGSDSDTVDIRNETKTSDVVEYGVPEIADEKTETQSEEIIVDNQVEIDEEDGSDAVDAAQDTEKESEQQVVETTSPPKSPEKDQAVQTTETAPEKPKEEKQPAEVAVKNPAPEVTKAPSDTSSMPKVDPNGRYTVQIGAFQNQTEAGKLESSLKSNGYPAFIKQTTTPDKKNWYRVRVGTFSTRSDAVRYGDILKNSEPRVKSVFITTNN